LSVVILVIFSGSRTGKNVGNRAGVQKGKMPQRGFGE
jgi:hypothetical protein